MRIVASEPSRVFKCSVWPQICFSLLAVIVSVLGGIGGFFVYLAKKSAAMAQAAEATKAAGDAADYHESLTRDGALEVHPTETEHELAGAPD